MMKNTFALILSLLFTWNFVDAQTCTPGTDMIFTLVEDMPRFPKCEHLTSDSDRKLCSDQKLLIFINENLIYPQAAYDNGTEGSVAIRFVVEKSGCVSMPEVLSGKGDGTDEETIRLVELMNELECRWKPGIQSDDTVRVYFTLPIKFRITDSTRVEGGMFEPYLCDQMSVATKESPIDKAPITVFPNPTNGATSIHFHSDLGTNSFYEIRNINGKKVQTGILSSGSGTANISLAELHNGYYLLLLYNKEQQVIARKKVLVLN